MSYPFTFSLLYPRRSAATYTHLKTKSLSANSDQSPYGDDESSLREALRRCPAYAYQAACHFRRTGNPDYVPAVLHGIIERFVDPELRPRLMQSADELRLQEDLGLDSLTLMEIIMLAEDVLQVCINSHDLRELRTLGQIKQYIRGGQNPHREESINPGAWAGAT